MLAACGKDEDDSAEKLPTENTEEDNINENGTEEQGDGDIGDTDEQDISYDIIQESEINTIDFSDLDESTTETIYIHHDTHEAFKYLRFAGSISDTIVDNNKYYFINSYDLYAHDKDTFEQTHAFTEKPFRPTLVNYTDKYSVFISEMAEFPITILNRETDETIEVPIESNEEHSTNVFPVSYDDLTLLGISNLIEDEQKIDLYALDLSSGDMQLVLENAFNSLYVLKELNIDDNQFYAFDTENNLYAYDRDTLEEVWKLDNNDLGLVDVNTFLDDEFLYVVTDQDSSVLKIDKQTGQYEVLFTSDSYDIGGVHVVDGDLLIVFGETADHFGFVNLATGEIEKEIQLDSEFYFSEIFNGNYYALLTNEDDVRSILKIPLDLNSDSTLINFETEGSDLALSMHIIKDVLYIGASRYFYTIK